MDGSWLLHGRNGRKYSLETSVTTVGRANCDVNVASRSVEKRHALIDWDWSSDGLRVTDLDSKHGTFLNDAPLPADVPVEVRCNDLLRFGLDPTGYEILRMNSEDSLNQDRRSRSSDRSSGSAAAHVDTNQQGPELEASTAASSGSSPMHRREEPVLSPTGSGPQQLFYSNPSSMPSNPPGFYYSHAVSQPALIYAQPMLLPPGPGLYYAPTGAPHPGLISAAPGAYIYQPMLASQCPHQGQAAQQHVIAQGSCPHCNSAPGNLGVHGGPEMLDEPQRKEAERKHSAETEPAPEEPNASGPSPESSRSTPEHSKAQRYHVGAKLEKEHGRTPLFGAQPAWWGEEGAEGAEGPGPHPQPILSHQISEPARAMTPEYPSRRSQTDHLTTWQNTAVSDTEAVNFRKTDSSSPPAGMGFGRRAMISKEAVRMDIPFRSSSPARSPVRRPPLQKARTEAPTAFTIQFDEPADKSSDKKPFSLQDAAKRGPSRRLNRRSAPTDLRRTRAASSDGKAKEYLLSKLLEGEESSSSSYEQPSAEISLVPKRERKDSDVVSEAGTYVVDRDSKNDMAKSQIIEDLELDSIVYQTPEEGSRTPSPTIVEHRSEPVSNHNASDQGSRKGLLKELLKMTQPTAQQPTTAAAPRKKLAGKPPAPQTRGSFSRECVHHHHPKQTPNNSAAGTSTTSFRRTDGGRFSMRTQGGAPSPKWTPAGKAKPKDPTQQSPEMAAWLRRKEYNPMKAAARSKGSSSSNSAESSPYLANRSNTFHLGDSPLKERRLLSQTSHTSSGRAGSEEQLPQTSDAMLAAYSKNITENLSKLVEDSAHSDAATVSIEMLEQLASTSQRLSGEASRAVNYLRSRRLSRSVEDLVRSMSCDSLDSILNEKSADQQVALKNVLAQMQNINIAFQAVNKYLEHTFPTEFNAPADSDTTPSDAGDNIKISRVRPYRLKPFH